MLADAATAGFSDVTNSERRSLNSDSIDEIPNSIDFK